VVRREAAEPRKPSAWLGNWCTRNNFPEITAKLHSGRAHKATAVPELMSNLNSPGSLKTIPLAWPKLVVPEPKSVQFPAPVLLTCLPRKKRARALDRGKFGNSGDGVAVEFSMPNRAEKRSKSALRLSKFTLASFIAAPGYYAR
jgi:hypothetical protein